MFSTIVMRSSASPTGRARSFGRYPRRCTGGRRRKVEADDGLTHPVVPVLVALALAAARCRSRPGGNRWCSASLLGQQPTVHEEGAPGKPVPRVMTTSAPMTPAPCTSASLATLVGSPKAVDRVAQRLNLDQASKSFRFTGGARTFLGHEVRPTEDDSVAHHAREPTGGTRSARGRGCNCPTQGADQAESPSGGIGYLVSTLTLSVTTALSTPRPTIDRQGMGERVDSTHGGTGTEGPPGSCRHLAVGVSMTATHPVGVRAGS